MTANTNADVAAMERVKPYAPQWDGFSKYGPQICFENGSLYIYAAGHGSKDGDGYLTFDPNESDWERDDETGKDYCVVPVDNSDLIFLRDQLNQWFPPALLQSQQAEITRLSAPVDDDVRELIETLRSRKDQEFDRECHLTNDEADRIIERLSSTGGQGNG